MSYEREVNDFTGKFCKYLELRNLYKKDGGDEVMHVVFPDPYGVPEREDFYASVSNTCLYAVRALTILVFHVYAHRTCIYMRT